MIVELAVVTALLIGGTPFAVAFGVRGPAVPAVGLVVGAALNVSVGALPVVLGLEGPPTLVLSATVGAGLLVAWKDRARLLPAVQQAAVVWGSGAALVLASVLWRWGAVNLTPDSFRYVTTGALLADGKLDQATDSLLLTRGLAVPILHSPANLSGEFHLRSLTPLFAVATVMVLVWAIRLGLRDAGVDRHTTWFVQVVAAVLLVSINRFVFHAFYVNGHMFIAGWLLLLATSIWVGTSRGRPPFAVTVIRCLLVVAIVLARPDGALLAGLVLLPLLVQRSVAPVVRFAPLMILGVTLLGWNLTIARSFLGQFGVPFEVQALLVLGVLLILVAIALFVRPQLLPSQFGQITELALWVMVVAASIRRPDVLKDSVRATYRNTLLGDGGWGVSLGVLGILILFVVAFSVDSSRFALRFPVTAFVPFSVLLAFLRDGAYRVGAGDSLNRMLIHMVPLAILLLASAVATSRWRGLFAVVPDDVDTTSPVQRPRDPS